jgi:hypothetical protein
MVRVKSAFFPVGWSRCNDAVDSITLRDDDYQDAASVSFAQMKGTRLSVAENYARVEWIVFYYLFCFLRCDSVAGDVFGVAVIPVELHWKVFLTFKISFVRDSSCGVPLLGIGW